MWTDARTRVTMNVGAGFSLTSAAGLLVVAGASSAGAAAACPAGSSEVSPGVCSVDFTSSGTFTPPAGVSTLQALLIGGGGAGQDNVCNSYTGGEAGAVTFVSAVSTAGPVSVVVGSGGVTTLPHCPDDPDGTAGGPTIITDAALTVSTATGGGFAAGTGGAGSTPSAFAASPALWPAYGGEPCFGDDGSDGDFTSGSAGDSGDLRLVTSNLPCGGGAPSDFSPSNASYNVAFTQGGFGTGSGGGSYSEFFDVDSDDWFAAQAGSGASGRVIFRFLKSEVLVIADTGPANAELGWVAAALVAVGAVLLTGARRVRRISV